MKKVLAVRVGMVLSLIVLWASTALGAVPNGPTSLIVSALTPTQIKLDWTDTSADETSFRIEKSSDGVLFAQVGTVTPDVTTSIYPVASNTLYYYRVVAVNGVESSVPSNVVAFTLDTIAPPAPVPTSPPMGDQLDTHSVQFQWNSVYDVSGVTYRIVVNDLANGITLHDVSGITSSNISLLLYDSNYEWYVIATDGAGNEGLQSASYYCLVVAIDHMAPDTVVTAPNGGEVLVVGDYFAITWYNLDQDFTSTPDLKIRIFFSHNNGGNWEQIASLGDNPGAFYWHVPNIICYESCLIRVTAENMAQMLGSDDSDFAFSIVSSNSHISVTDSILSVDDHKMAFGNITEGVTSQTETIGITNDGYTELTVSNIELWGDASQFILNLDGGSSPCRIPPALEAGGYCTITVTFIPLSTGDKSATLVITSSDSNNGTVSVALSGSGLSSSTNNAPSESVLLFPANGQTGLGTDVTCRWKKSQDPDGDAVTYSVYYSTDESFSNSTPITVANHGTPKAFYAYAGMPGLLLIGAIFAAPLAGRKKLVMLMITLILLGGVVGACSRGGGGNDTSAASSELSQSMSLNPGTTYYWKVVADDGKGGTAESAVWSFTTQ